MSQGATGRISASAANIPLGMAMWFKAQVGLFTTSGGSTPATANGDAVGRWEDQSGFARNVTQTISGQRGAISTSGVNGYYVVEFNGGGKNLLLPTSTYTIPAPYTVLMVADQISHASNAGIWGGTDVNNVIEQRLPSPDIKARIGGNQGTLFTAWSLNQWAVIRLRTTPTTIALSKNTGAETVDTITPANITRMQFCDVAANGNDIKIAELIVYPRSLSNAELLAATNYLMAKYGL